MGISWGEAYKKAILTIIYAIIWWIIGLVILFVGVIVAFQMSNAIGVLLSMIISLVGIVIMALGFLASIFKVAAD